MKDPDSGEWIEKKVDHRIMLSQVSFGSPSGVNYSYMDFVNHPEPWPYGDFMRWTANPSKSSGGRYDGKSYYFNRNDDASAPAVNQLKKRFARF
jgi:hypothetical protein